MPIRKIVLIDEEKCDGCGLCASVCHEGAIQIMDGRARLVSDILCDGFGDCLGECPQGAITIVERQAEAYNEDAVKAHLGRPGPPAVALPTIGGCPGSAVRQLVPLGAHSGRTDGAEKNAAEAHRSSALTNWPVQLHLAPVQAPYFAGARLLIAADCVPFAMAGFHERLLGGNTLLIGCPKLDDTSAYREKLAAIFRFNDIRSVDIAVMEVPCCRGLVHLVHQALDDAGKADLLRPAQTTVGIRGDVLGRIE